jgi:hypothetical protein
LIYQYQPTLQRQAERGTRRGTFGTDTDLKIPQHHEKDQKNQPTPSFDVFFGIIGISQLLLEPHVSGLMEDIGGNWQQLGSSQLRIADGAHLRHPGGEEAS